LNLFRFSSFAFRASPKGTFYQQKCQANARPTRPITTLYLSFDPKTLIKKAPFPREFDPRTNPHNDPKIAIPLIDPLWRPRNPTSTLEGFTEKSTGTLENFPQNPTGAPENPCSTPQSFPESPAEGPDNPRSSPRNPHFPRKDRRKKISILNFQRQKFNKGQRPKSYEKIPPLVSTDSCPLLSVFRHPSSVVCPCPLAAHFFLCKTNPILLDKTMMQTFMLQRVMKMGMLPASEKQTQSNPISNPASVPNHAWCAPGRRFSLGNGLLLRFVLEFRAGFDRDRRLVRIAWEMILLRHRRVFCRPVWLAG
jgi:hypothetical protein